jgi:hypothetical protein
MYSLPPETHAAFTRWNTPLSDMCKWWRDGGMVQPQLTFKGAGRWHMSFHIDRVLSESVNMLQRTTDGSGVCLGFILQIKRAAALSRPSATIAGAGACSLSPLSICNNARCSVALWSLPAPQVPGAGDTNDGSLTDLQPLCRQAAALGRCVT